MRKRICSFVGFLSRGRLGVHVEPFEFFSVHVRGYGRLTEEGAGDEEDRPLVVRVLMKPSAAISSSLSEPELACEDRSSAF